MDASVGGEVGGVELAAMMTVRVEVQEKKRWRRELKEGPSFHDFGKPAVERFVGYHFVQISPVDKPHLACGAHHVISAEECSGGHAGDADLLRALHDA